MATGIAAAYPSRYSSADAPRLSFAAPPDVVGSEPRRPAPRATEEAGMKFLAIIYNDESNYANATPEDIGAIFAAHGKFGEDSRAAGVFAGGEGLQGASTATTVRVR